MNKILKFISITGLAFLIISIFVLPVKAETPDILDITFEQTPLFTNANFLPGDQVVRWVTVENKDANNSYTIATKADKIINSDNLSEVFELTIFNADTNEIYYKNTLTNFFNQGVVELSELAQNEIIKYNYKIYFQNTDDNYYQGKHLEFDIIVGDGDKETIGEENNGGSSGGGGGYSYKGLIISNEAVVDVTNNSATITWTTSESATSRVIFDKISHSDLTNCSSPNYCYSNSNTENSTKITGHSMQINNLDSDTTYYFRPVSHASPEKTGKELSFTTLLKENNNKNNAGEVAGEQTEEKNIQEEKNKQVADKSPFVSKETTEDNQEKEFVPQILDKKIKGASETKPETTIEKCFVCNFWMWVIILILLLSLVTGYYFVLKNKDEL